MPAFAADVIDQNQSSGITPISNFGQSNLFQSFEQTDDNISGAGIYLSALLGSGAGMLTIDLYDALPSLVSANLLASGSAAITGNNRWIDVFWAPVSITSGATYFLEFSATNSSYRLRGSLLNPYGAGRAYGGLAINALPNIDYSFRTYASDVVAAVPEPGTWAMLIAGFAAVGTAMRRRPAKVSFA